MLPSFPKCPQCDEELPFSVAPHKGCDLQVTPQPGTLEHEIYYGWAEYPTLYGRNKYARWHIIHQLFIVNGNGMDWENGRLVDVCDERGESVHFVTAQEYAAELDQRHSSWKETEEYLAKISGKPSKWFDPDALNEQWATMQWRELTYPMCQFADVTCVPADVLPDWLDGARDAVLLIEEYPDSYETRDKYNTFWAVMVRTDLTERFGAF